MIMKCFLLISDVVTSDVVTSYVDCMLRVLVSWWGPNDPIACVADVFFFFLLLKKVMAAMTQKRAAEFRV